MAFDQADPATTALFAISVILIVVYLGIGLLSIRGKWTYKDRSDTLRSIAIRTAVGAILLETILSVAELAVEGNTFNDTTYFQIIFIFDSLLGLIAALAVMVILSRMVLAQLHLCNAPTGLTKVVKGTSIVTFILITLLELAYFGLYVAYIAKSIKGYNDYYSGFGFRFDSIQTARLRIGFVLSLITTLFVSFLLLVTITKAGSAVNSRATRTLVLAALVLYFIDRFLGLIVEGIANFGDTGIHYYQFDLGYQFIGIILFAVFLALVVALGLGSHRRNLAALGDSSDDLEPHGQQKYDSVSYPEVAQNGAADRHDEQSYPPSYSYGGPEGMKVVS